MVILNDISENIFRKQHLCHFVKIQAYIIKPIETISNLNFLRLFMQVLGDIINLYKNK